MAARVVLVHGAWHGAWCFTRVVSRLRDAGVEATAIDLPGHGSDSGALTDLPGDTVYLRSVLDGAEAPVVLVGHSYGGAVITAAGDHPAIGHLVYLCAFALDTGESCQSVAARAPEIAGSGDDGAPARELLVVGESGTTVLTPEGAAGRFYNDCDDATIAWAVGRLCPQPMLALEQSPVAVAWRQRPSTYAVCRDDLVIRPALQRAMAARCSTAVEWPTGHSPFLSRPDLVADLLEGLAQSLTPADRP